MGPFKIMRLLAAFAVCLLVSSSVMAEPGTIYRVDGTLTQINPQARDLTIRFEHPVTGEQVDKYFKVAADAGFNHFKKLEKLKTGDMISIDYTEDAQKNATAIYIIYIALKRSFVTHKEVADALVQIKKN